MILSTSTNLFHERIGEPFISAADSIRICTEAGFRALDLCFVTQVLTAPDFLGKQWRDYLLSLRALAENQGATFVQGHGMIYEFCNGLRSEQMEILFRCLEGSMLLGIPWLVMHPSTLVTDGRVDSRTMEKNVDFFRWLSDKAGRYGVGIAIENMWGRTREGVRRFAVDPAELLELVCRVDAENVGVCWDAEHGSIEGLNQRQAILSLGRFLKATHISDQTAADNIHILPYMGFTDWDEVLRALAEADYGGTFNFEIQHYLLRVPLEVVPAAARLACIVGQYMANRLEMFRHDT